MCLFFVEIFYLLSCWIIILMQVVRGYVWKSLLWFIINISILFLEREGLLYEKVHLFFTTNGEEMKDKNYFKFFSF